MKKKFLFAALFSAALFAGSLNAAADNLEPLNEANVVLVNGVVNNQMSDPDLANKNFSKFLTKNKTNAKQLLSGGRFFLEKGIYPCAKQCAERAYQLEPQNVDVLMLSGEVYMLGKQYAMAGQKFDEILNIDPNNIYALKNSARVYKHVNPVVAVEALNKIKEVEPNNFDADKELGDISYNMSEYKNAVKSYDSYYANVPHTKDALEIRSVENYLQSLYSTGEFDKAVKVLDEVQNLDAGNLVFKRMRFFNTFENYNALATAANLEAAKAAANYIEQKEYADSLYLFLDYAYLAKLKSETEDYAAAVKYQQLAVAADSTKAAGLKDLADYMAKNKQADEALDVYQRYLDKIGDGAKNADWFRLARMYSAAARAAEGEKRAAYLAKMDATLDKVEANNPGNPAIARTRAQLHIMGSSVQDDVKALYEKYLGIAEGKEGEEDGLISAYEYLMVYGIQKDNMEMARTYCDKLLKLDATHETAKKANDFLKSQGK